MSAGGAVDRLRDFLRRHDALTVLVIVFLCLIFLTRNTQVYRWVFYAGVLPVFALVAERRVLAEVAHSWVWRLALVLGVYLWLTLLWADAAMAKDFVGFARRLVMISLFVTVIAHLVVDRPGFTDLLLRSLVLWAALLAVAYMALDFSFGAGQVFYRARMFGLRNPNVAGAVCGTLLAGGVFLLLRSQQPRREKIVFALALFVLTIFVVLTKSRGNMLALAATIIIGALLTRRREIVLGAGMAIAAFVGMAAVGLVDVIHLLARGDSYRLLAWQHHWEIWQGHIWGIGLNFNPIFTSPDGVDIYHAHNVYLAYLTYGGVPALALFVLMLLAAFRAAYTAHLREQDMVYLAMLTFVAIYGIGDFSVYAENANYTWLHFWLPLALCAGAEARLRRASPAAARVAPA
jgi:hypothetical protein